MEKKTKKKGKVLKIIIIILAVNMFLSLVAVGYFGLWGPFKFLNDMRMSNIPGNAKEYHLENVNTLENSPLKGKKILFLGSSVTYGSASMQVSMADYLGAIDGCEITKEAVSGTTLADLNGTSYLSRLKNVDKTKQFDAVVVQLSTNDASKKIDLGTISKSKDASQFDTQTVIGAMEAIICYCQETWNCPVIFYTGTKYDSSEYEAMVKALLELQDKWNIGVIDLWNDTEMNAISDKDYKLYMNDKIHPTQAGYLLWWTPKFQEYLYEYLDEK